MMNSMANLLAKFDTVEVKSSNLISEADKLFCEKNQAAYEAAVTSYQELSFCWEDMVKAQRELLGEPDSKKNSLYFNYLSKADGAHIDADVVREHIEKLHGDYLSRIAQYFKDSYRVDLDIPKIRRALLPKKPNYGAEKDDIAVYREQMEGLMIRYQVILDLIFEQMDGRSFTEQAMYELKTGCHKAAWNQDTREARYELKKDTIKFLTVFSRYIYRHHGWQDPDWLLTDKMKAIMSGVGHFETGRYRDFPPDIEGLLTDHNTWDVVELEDCSKVRQLKMFKNGNVYLKFVSASTAEEFIRDYLGTAA